MGVVGIHLDGALQDFQRFGVVFAPAMVVEHLAGEYAFVSGHIGRRFCRARSWLSASIRPGSVETITAVISSWIAKMSSSLRS
jgi:hypothetical protein